MKHLAFSFGLDLPARPQCLLHRGIQEQTLLPSPVHLKSLSQHPISETSFFGTENTTRDPSPSGRRHPGAVSHGRDYRRSAGGFIHGFRRSRIRTQVSVVKSGSFFGDLHIGHIRQLNAINEIGRDPWIRKSWIPQRKKSADAEHPMYQR